MGFGRLFRRLVHLPRRDDRAVTRDVDDEITFHLDMRVRDLVARGASASDARARATAEFGNVGSARRTLSAEGRGFAREQRRAQWLQDVVSDVRFSIRQLRRTPTFTIVAVLTLALGIGANTAIMSVVRGVLLRPLPFRASERLVRIYATSPATARGSLSVPDFLDFQSGATGTLSAMASYYTTTANLTGNGEPERLDIAKVDANWFSLLGVRPLVGREFLAGEGAEGAKRVTMLGESLWRRLYGSDRGIVGRAIVLDGNPVEVVGVVPDAERLPARMDLWTPTRYSAEERSPAERGAHWLGAIARLRDGTSLAQANGDLVRIARQLERQDPKHNALQSARAIPLEEALISDVERPLYILLGAVGLVMLIACINVAGLLLARTAARDTEIAVRTAIGAGRGRIVRQLLTESLVLSLVGAGFGFTLAVAGTRLLVRAAPVDTPRLDQVHLDGTMFAFALALATVTGLIFGLVPALHAASRELQSRLKDSSRGAAGKLGGGRLRRALVIAELALSIMLLAGAGLLLRSFAHLQRVDPGFKTAGRTMFTVVLPEKSYPTLQSQRQFLSDALAGVGAVPGVRSVAATFGLPLSDTRFSLTFTVDGRPAPSPQDEPTGQVRIATVDYFKTLGIPLIRGRTFTELDRLETPQVMVVSEKLVRRYFPNEDPIGKRIGTGWHREGRTFGGEIVGVVGDVRQFGLKDDAPPMYYAAADQWPSDEIVVVVDAMSPSEALIPALRTAIGGIDRDLPLFDVRTVDALVADALAPPRFYLGLLGGFAAVSLVLAAVGIYGVIAYGVRQRTREIGVRMALGATSARILRMVVGEGLLLTAVGIGLGICGALLLTGELKTLLYNVQPNDRATLVIVSLLLTAVAVGACLVPARVASRVEPQGALRGD